MTAISVPSGSRGARDRLRSFNYLHGVLHRFKSAPMNARFSPPPHSIFSFSIAGQVLTFRTRARLSFAPPPCRMPLGQSQCIPQADPETSISPYFTSIFSIFATRFFQMPAGVVGIGGGKKLVGIGGGEKTPRIFRWSFFRCPRALTKNIAWDRGRTFFGGRWSALQFLIENDPNLR